MKKAVIVQPGDSTKVEKLAPSVNGDINLFEVPTDYSPYADYGSSGLNRWGNNVSEDFLTQLRYPQAAKIYKEMSDNDPTIGAIMFMAKQLIRKSQWTVEPGDQSASSKDAAEFLEQCMEDMSMAWNDTITEIVSMLIYGWSFHEIIYKVRGGPKAKDGMYRSKYDDGRIGWKKIPIRSQGSMYGWVFDPFDGDIKGFIQTPAPHFEHITIPMSKGLLFRTEVSRDNPEGRSCLRNAYRPWYFKKRMEEIEGIGIERDLAGLPVITPPENTDIWNPQNKQGQQYLAQAQKIVRNIKRDRNEGIVKPFGWELQLLSSGGSRQFDTNAIIGRYDQRIAITMLADIVMMGADKVGSFALGDVKKSLLAASLEAFVTSIANVFNKYAVPALFDLNYFPGLKELPKLVPGEVEVPDLKQVAFLLRSAGLDVTKDFKLMNFVRELISVKPLTEAEFDEIYKESVDDGLGDGKQTENNQGGTNGQAQDVKNQDVVEDALNDGNDTFVGR